MSTPIITRRYCPENRDEWNNFVSESRNGTFLFDRNYMDYHSDRFEDSSLLFYNSRNRLLAILPANRAGDMLYSHQGLTYGGLITKNDACAELVYDIFESMNTFLKGEGIRRVVYKAIPWIYHSYPSEEDLYALTYVSKARLVSRDISSAFPLSCRLRFTESRRAGIRKARKAGITVTESDKLEDFWQVLSDNLMARHHATPVHTLDEIKLLMSRFPGNIRLYTAELSGKVVAGTILYICKEVVHTQYISASPEGKACGALDILFDHIINNEYSGRHFFDFGKSTEHDGSVLNRSLIFQKEGFGARGVCYDTYEWEL